MRISIIGAGYVGLVSGACLADLGHQVTCVDIDPKRVNDINSAVPPFYERGLDALLRRHAGRNLRATSDTATAVLDTDLTIIAAGTPFNGQEIDLTQVEAAAKGIAAGLRMKSLYHVVAVKSTVVPGTTDTFVGPILERASGKRLGADFGLAVNPEFLREGSAVEDFMDPDRIVIGSLDARTREIMTEIYAEFEGVDVLCTTNRTAELIKYTANSLLATLVSFSNEFANLCSAIGDVDIVEVMRGVHLDRRVSPLLPGGQRLTPGIVEYLKAGCGYGGSCLPKDTKSIVAYGENMGLPMSLMKSVVQVNEGQPYQIVRLLKKHYPSLAGRRLTVLGLAFKTGTEDVRESPAIPVIREVLAEGALVTAYDPMVGSEAMALFGFEEGFRVVDCLQDAMNESDAVIVLVGSAEFMELLPLLSEMSPQPLVIDGRRFLDKDKIAKYEGIGVSGSQSCLFGGIQIAEHAVPGTFHS